MPSLAEVLENTTSPRSEVRNYVLAGFTMRLIGEPEWLEVLSEAFTHLPSSERIPDLIVHLRCKLPELEGVNQDQIHWLNPTDPKTKQLFDPHSGMALYQFELPILTHQQCAPLLHILRMFLESRQITLLHAAVIATLKGAALLVGRGGSGKSTTALMALKAGLQYLADDYCALGFIAEPMVYSLFSSAKFHFKDAERLHFLTMCRNPDLEKGFAMLKANYAKQLPTASPIKIILLPTLGGHLGFEPISPQTALLALAPSSLFQLNTKQQALKHMSHLVQVVPSYRLLLGNDPNAVPNAIQGLLEGL